MSDQTLHYTMTGEGPPLMLLHPVGLDNTFWGENLDVWARRHRVIAVDLRGHGRSFPASGDEMMADYVADVAQLMTELRLADVTLLGLSFGGMIAQEVALLKTGIVSRLIVGACGPSIPDEAREAVRNRGALSSENGMRDVVDDTIARWFTPDFMGDPKVQRVRERLLTDDPLGWRAGWNAISGHNALPRLPGLTLPALVVVGDQDLGTPAASARSIADAIPDADFTVVAGAPHMLQIERPDDFAAAVRPFLAPAR